MDIAVGAISEFMLEKLNVVDPVGDVLRTPVDQDNEVLILVEATKGLRRMVRIIECLHFGHAGVKIAVVAAVPSFDILVSYESSTSNAQVTTLV